MGFSSPAVSCVGCELTRLRNLDALSSRSAWFGPSLRPGKPLNSFQDAPSSARSGSSNLPIWERESWLLQDKCLAIFYLPPTQIACLLSKANTVQWTYGRRLELFRHFKIARPNYSRWVCWQAADEADNVDRTAAPRQGLLSVIQVDNVHRLSAPSEGVHSAAQESDSQRSSMNRRPKISDSWLAVKWTAIRPTLNMHYQALIIPSLRYDCKELGTEACHRPRNCRLIKDAAKCILNAEQNGDFSDDISKECGQHSEPDGMRYVYGFVHT
jgi:hypothetical protein